MKPGQFCTLNKDSLAQLISGKNTDWQQAVSGCKDSVGLVSYDLLDTLSGLPEMEPYEINFKTVFTAILTTLAGDTLSAGLTDDLVNLASACYNEYGEMVLYAIAFMDKDSQAAYFAILRDSCATEERTISTRRVKHNHLTLAPVPASDYVYLSYGGTSDENLRYAIYNVSGSLSLQGTVLNGGPISTKFLPSGIYFVKVYILENYIQTLPLILIRQ